MTITAKHRGDQGFTLVELLVTLAILGIMTAISVVAVGGALRAAQIKSCLADWNSVYVAANAWVNDQTIGNSTITTYPNIDGLVTAGYLVTNPNTDKTVDRRYSLDLPSPTSGSTIWQPSVIQYGSTLSAPANDSSLGAACKALSS